MLFSASDQVTKVSYRSTIMLMMALLFRSAATTRFSVNAFSSSIQPRQSAYVTGWAKPRHNTICSINTHAVFSRPNVNPRRHQYFSTLQTLQDAKTSFEDTITEESESKRKGLSRKQRVRKTKETNLQRIDKILAHRGVGTRKETFELAKSKRITFASRPDAPHEERTRIRGPKDKVPFAASIFLDGKCLPGPAPLLLVYHKPKYVLSVMEDDKKWQDQQRKHLGQMLEQRYKKAGMHPVGRLDYDTTGLILFSLDGKLTQILLHPRRGVEKEYVATVQGKADEAKLTKKLADGVETTEGVHKAKLIAVTPSDGPTDDDGELEEIMNMETGEEDDEQGGDDEKGLDDYSGPYSDVRLVVSEGKYRMVRRILANCGHPVVELRRLRHGKVELGNLKMGEFREVTADELDWAKSLIK